MYTWSSPDGKTHNHFDHILIDRRWHSSILDVRSFREGNCDTVGCKNERKTGSKEISKTEV